MQTVALIANIVTIIATVAGLIGGAVTVYTGHLQKLVQAIQDVPKIKRAVQRIDDRSETNGKMIHTLSVAVAHDRDPDPEAFANDLGVDEGVGQYFEDGYSNGRTGD